MLKTASLLIAIIVLAGCSSDDAQTEVEGTGPPDSSTAEMDAETQDAEGGAEDSAEDTADEADVPLSTDVAVADCLGPGCDDDDVQILACSPGTTVCNGPLVESCNETGDTLEVTDCSPGSCVEGSCVPCDAGETFCFNENVYFCGLDGAGSVLFEDCDDELGCNNGACVLCSPGAGYCEENLAFQCEKDGTEGFSETLCPAPFACAGGKCVDPCEGDKFSPECAEQQCVPELLEPDSTPVDPSCIFETVEGPFNAVVEWKKSEWAVNPFSTAIMMTPIVTSLTDDNGDGAIDELDDPDIVAVTYGFEGGTLRAVSGVDGSEIFSATTTNLQITTAVAAGDVDGDGIVELAACAFDTVKLFEHTGSLKWTSPPLTGHIDGTSDAPAIADLDADGLPEVIVGRAILNGADGSIKGVGEFGIGSTVNVGTTSFAADVDLDGVQEVVVGNAIYGPDGTAEWYNGLPDGYVAAGNFDDDPEAEIVVVWEGQVRLQDTDGSVIWLKQFSFFPLPENLSYGGPPTIADFDGDSAPEIGIAGRDVYAVLDTNGDILWEQPTTDKSSGATGSSVFDFDGDGIAEVVYADETRVWVFSGPDGEVKLEFPEHNSGTWTEYPTIADVDADGQAEIVVAQNKTSPTPGSPGVETGIMVLGDADGIWLAGRRTWNQHAYSITNVDEGGGIPTSPEANWTTYNSFRSGDLVSVAGGQLANLSAVVDDPCPEACASSQIIGTYRLRNTGPAAVAGPIELALHVKATGGATEVWTSTYPGPLPGGSLSESLELNATISGIPLAEVTSIELLVDTTDAVEECNEMDNTIPWPLDGCLD